MPYVKPVFRILASLFVTSTLVGCSAKPPSDDPPDSRSRAASIDANESDDSNATPTSTTEQSEFSNKWKAATDEERRVMADLAKVYPLFNGATKAQIRNSFGPATETGIDRFGDDVMRYELGAIPESDGGGQYHLTFVFENEKVIRVMGNAITISL